MSHFLVVDVFPLKDLCHHLDFLWTADLILTFHGQNNCQRSNKSNQANQNAALWHVCFQSVSGVKHSCNNGSQVPWQMARSTFTVPWAPLTFRFFYHTGISTDPSLSPVDRGFHKHCKTWYSFHGIPLSENSSLHPLIIFYLWDFCVWCHTHSKATVW